MKTIGTYELLADQGVTIPVAGNSGYGTNIQLVANMVYVSNVLTYTVTANGDEEEWYFDDIKAACAKYDELVGASASRARQKN